MGKVLLKGMQFKSRIGVYAFEQQYGNHIRVDIELESPQISGNTDNLEDTIDYAGIYGVVKEVIEVPCQLLEYAARKIIDRLVARNLTGDYLRITVTKLQPPLGDTVDEVSIQLEWQK